MVVFRLLPWVLVCAFAAGCVDPRGVACSDGRICPVGSVCDVAHEGCAEAAQLTACQGREDGDTCSVRGSAGACDLGVCLGVTCGDGRVTTGEACDDGNTENGDGCSADCLSSETCGNGRIDEGTNEVCDCGTDAVAAGCVTVNSDAPGSSCKLNCQPHCGDGEQNEVEECDTVAVATCRDFGFDRGALGCTASCGHDFARCANLGVQHAGGPGVVNALSRGIWAAETGEIFIVGGQYRAVYSAGRWEIATDTAPMTWMAVHGIAADQVYAVGMTGGIQVKDRMARWDGTKWIEIPRMEDGIPGDKGLVDVLVNSPTDIVAVGPILALPNSGGRVLRYDSVADQWSFLDVTDGDAPTTVAALNDTGDFLVGGGGGMIIRRINGVVQAEQSIAGMGVAVDAYATSATQMFVVNNTGALYQSSNGIQWDKVTVPTVGPLLRIVARSESEVYVLGSGGAALYFDGTRWLPLRTGQDRSFASTVRVGDRILAGANNFILFEVLPEAWTDVPVSGSGQTEVSWAGGVVYMAADDYLTKLTDTGTEKLTAFPLEFDSRIAAASPTSVFISRGTDVVLYDEQDPTQFPVVHTCPERVMGLWSDGNDRFAAALANGSVQIWTPEGVTTIDPTGLDDISTYTALSGNSSGILATTTATGEVWSNRTGAWARDLAGEEPLYAVWVAPDGQIFAGGEAGRIWHFDGVDWGPMVSQSPERILSIHGSSSSDIFAASVGVLQHYNGSQWAPVTAEQPVTSVAASAGDVYFGSGSPAGLRRLHRRTSW